jgi:hypothetical protein
MNDAAHNAVDARVRTPVHLWVVAVLSLLWNLMGAFDYLATQLKLDFYVDKFTDARLAYFYAIPAWAVAGWAFGVWGAVAGSVGLLLRRRWSVWALGISIAGLFVSTIYNFGMSNGAEIMGTGGVIFSVVIWLIAIVLFLYARAMSSRGVLA